MAKGKILVLDPHPAPVERLLAWCRAEGYQASAAATARQALEAIERERWDLVLIDEVFDGAEGWEIRGRLAETDPDTPVMITTAQPTVEAAVRAFKNGACDYIAKPYDFAALAPLVERALERLRASREVRRLREQLGQVTLASHLVGQSPAMRRVLQQIETVAPTDATVLITGESGTGKEAVARAIHARSPRRFFPLVIVHCGAMNGTLLETELFGAEPQAVPNLAHRKRGKFEAADGGTVFLDEVSELGPQIQSELLRVLQDRQVCRIGAAKPVKVDFRCIAATNKALDRLVRQGLFRSQLYYRLNTFAIDLPPLRDRREDIPLLVDHFLREYAALMNRPVPAVSKPAMDLLLNYRWPGNVRELENAIERALVIRKEGPIQPEDFPFQREAEPEETSQSLEEIERRHIERIVREANWNLSRAARILKIDRTTLYNKLKRYGLR
jgi:DNA-binding NtrC family response regulator